MRRRKKRQTKYQWLNRTGSYHLLAIPIKNWLLIFLFFVCITAGISFFVIQDSVSPTTERFVAKISGMWIEQYNDETGGHNVYRVRLKQGEKEFACSVSPVGIHLWNQLEPDKSYEFSITRTGRQCFIHEVIKH